MATVTFNEVAIHGQKSVKCAGGCGRRLKRSKKFWQTLSPFNKNALGELKTREETTGLADQKGDGPAAVFRNWLLRGQTQVRARAERRLIYKKTEIALDAFLKGESIQRLGSMSVDKELFPIPAEHVKVIKDGKAIRKAKPVTLVESAR